MMMNNHKSVLVLALVIAVGTIVFVQQNATNQTSTYNYTAQAKPDQTKFCADFNNDDGTIGTSCEYKSQGECKKGSIAAGDDFRECHKNQNGDSEPEEPDGSGSEE
jgi:hypothetical protein